MRPTVTISKYLKINLGKYCQEQINTPAAVVLYTESGLYT